MFMVIFPRSGTHLMLHIFKQQFNYELPSLHHIKEAKEITGKIITVIRDPYEAIHSCLVMRAHYGLEENQKDLIQYYIDLYSYLYNRADVIIDYNTLANNQDLIRDYIYKELHLEYNGMDYKNTMKDKPDKKHLVTAQSSHFYNVDFLKGYDLTRAYQVYNRLISIKSI